MIRLEKFYFERPQWPSSFKISVSVNDEKSQISKSRIQDSSKATLNTLVSWSFSLQKSEYRLLSQYLFFEMGIHEERMSIPDWSLVVDRLAERTTDLETG